MNMTIKERIEAPTPPFFKKVRNTGLAIAAIAATHLASPVALPAIVLKIAAYLAVAGTVATTVSQAVTPHEDQDHEHSLAVVPNG